MTTEPLSPQDVAVLDFEQRWQHRAVRDGSKDAAIVEEFGLNTTAYFQRLNRLLDSRAALARYPQLVYRLRRVRDARAVLLGVLPS